MKRLHVHVQISLGTKLYIVTLSTIYFLQPCTLKILVFNLFDVTQASARMKTARDKHDNEISHAVSDYKIYTIF